MKSEHENWRTKPEDILPSQVSRMEKADIVIIGAGHAGTCAARAAAEAGASVIVLEQQSIDKQTILGIGEIGHINSKWQEKHGVAPVDIDTFVNDWQLRTGNRSNERLIRTYAKQCGSCFDWFIEPLTEEEQDRIHPMMTPPDPHFPYVLNGLHSWPGTPDMGVELQNNAVKANQQLARKLGARFFFDTKACQLQKTGKRVTGVFAPLPDGSYILFQAKKGVLLAAGDYSRNPQMCADLLTEAADLIEDGADFTGHGWDGSGIRMGMWAGGRLEPRSHAAMGGNYSFPGFGVIGSTAVLRVNSHGRRYSDEGFGTHILAALPGARQPNGMLWGIFDSNILDQIRRQPANHGEFDYTDPARLAALEQELSEAEKAKGKTTLDRDKAGERRPLICADTLEELASALFADAEDQQTFLTEVSRYNAFCLQGRDEDFGKDPQLLYPIQKAPFFATGTLKSSHRPGGQSLKILVTVSGLMIDEHQQVLDEEFEPIDGLYATGNSSGCRFGAQYTTSLPGQSISIAQTLGREAGRWIASLK